MSERIKGQQAESVGEEENSTWAFRGYHLEPGHFTTAMVHFYRGELARSNTWRTRLDATTNWAVVSAGAALTFVFGAEDNPHFLLLLVFALLLTFLYIEARRYRYYVLWAYRVHLLETDFFAAMLAPPFRPSADWASHLVETLLQPTFPIAQWEAVGRRFLRNYVWLITLLLVSWGIKLALHPTQAVDWPAIVERAGIGSIPGQVVVIAVGAVYGALAMLGAVSSLAASVPPGEALPGALRWLGRRGRRGAGPLVQEPRRQPCIATIITGRGQQIAIRLLEELERGVTALRGTGMYTGESKDVLLCAVTEVQVPHLEEIVYQLDPNAFLVVSATERVQGRGFRPFEAPS
jgi:uncharacterized membrane protein